MKLLKNEKIKQKIIILLVFILTINFIIPNYSQAKVDRTLIDPIITFVTWLGDGTLNILQTTFLGEEAVFDTYSKYQTKKALIGGVILSSSQTNNILLNNPLLEGGALKQVIDGIENWEGPTILCKYSIAAIISNRIPALDINFFNPNITTNVEEEKSSTMILKENIQKWYVALRNVALVALLSILVYLGIKIILSSTAEEKAGYKKKIINWIVALCILFSLHYIMSITLYVVNLISQSLQVEIVTEDGYDAILPAIRYSTELAETFQERLAYTLMYIVIIVYTVIFTFTYLKRTIFIAFLTMFAPLVAVTYPIDKENDGKAQAFDYWIKEYFFNIIMQPIHLLLYYIFVTMAMDLVKSNIIYALVAIGFIIPGEKIIRKMFNFEKQGEDSSAGGFAQGALIGTAINSISRLGKGKHSESSSKDSRDEDERDTNIKTADINEIFGTDSFLGDNLIGDDIDLKLGDSNGLNGEFNYANNPYSFNSSGTSPRKTDIKQPNIGNVNTGNTKLKGNTSNNNLSTDSIENIKSKKSIKRGVGAVARRFTGKGLAKFARGAGKLSLGAVGLAIGGAAGIATGDLNNVFKYGATGAAAGIGSINALSAGIHGVATTGKAVKQGVIANADEFRIGYNNYTQKEYEQNILIPRIQKENEKNREVKDKYRKVFGNTELLESSARTELYKAGITDENLIIEALKVQQENSNLSDKELVRDTVMASKIKSAKDAETREKQLKKIFENNGAFRNLEKTLENKGAFKDIDSNLKEKYDKIDKNNKMDDKDKEDAKESLRQQEKDKIVDKEKDRLVSGRMRIIRKISGID